MADQGLPVGVATFRSFRMRAISRADFTCELIEQRRQRLRLLDCGRLGFASIVPQPAELLSICLR